MVDVAVVDEVVVAVVVASSGQALTLPVPPPPQLAVFWGQGVQ
jgi:hypothetical protein